MEYKLLTNLWKNQKNNSGVKIKVIIKIKDATNNIN